MLTAPCAQLLVELAVGGERLLEEEVTKLLVPPATRVLLLLLARSVIGKFFIVSRYYIINLGCFMCIIMLFYIIFGTNLST